MTFIFVGIAMSVAFIGLGGAIYEFIVRDAIWAGRLPQMTAEQKDVRRNRFWMPIKLSFEFLLVASLVVAWPRAEIRFWLLMALASHAAANVWSVAYFISEILRPVRAIVLMEFFEVTQKVSASEKAPNRIGSSSLRVTLDTVTCVAMFAALVLAAH